MRCHQEIIAEFVEQGAAGDSNYKEVTIVVTNLKKYQTALGGKDEFKIKAKIE